jgi:hypothetical protein
MALVFTMAMPLGQAQSARLRIIGIVEVPRVFVYSNAGLVTPDKTLRIDLRRQPSPQSPITATVSAPDQIESKEYGYEIAGAVVYARDGGWSLVRTSTGATGWLAPGDSGTFHSLESLVTTGLPFLTDDWDGFVSAAPGSGRRQLVPGDPARRLVGYLVPQVETTVAYPVFERPERSAPIITRVTAKEPDVALQTSHRIPHQVLVLDRRPGWFQVAPADQAPGQMAGAWLEEAPVWGFQPLTDEAERRELATLSWGPESWSVQTLGTRQVGDALWVEVEVLSHSPCEGSRTPPTVRAHGWIPAHASSGAPTIWFYSRGC